jgi:hypothetical protein
MRDECVEAVEEALGRNLRRGESEKIEAAVNSQMRLLARKDPGAWAAKSQWDRLQEASQAAAAAMSEEANLKLRRLRLQVAAHDRIENAVADMFEKLPDNAKPGARLKAVSQLLAFDAGGRGMRSVETNAHAISQEAFGRLMPLWTSVKGFAHLFESGKGISDLVHEMYGEDTGNAAAKEGARLWRQTADEMRDRANASGANIGTLEDWHYPQTHSQARVAQAGGHNDPSMALEKWVSDTLPLLDRDKYVNADGSRMSDHEVNDFLTHAWESIAMDGMNKIEPGKGVGSGGVANRSAAHRQIFFKDAESYLSYQGLYGDKNLFSVLTSHIRSMSRDIALMETLGPNPEKTFNYFNERTLQDEMHMNPGAKKTITSAKALNDSLYDNVSGRTQVVNQRIADIGQTFRNFETATKLGQVVITALGDEAGMSATAYANKIPWTEVLARELTYMNPLNGEDRAAAAHAGLGINGIIGGINRFGTEDLALARGVGGSAKAKETTARLATATLNLSGAEAMWDMRRRALGSVLMSYLGKTVGEVEHFADLNRSDHGILATKGIDEKVWQTWRLAAPEDWGMKHGVLTAKSIRDIPDAKLAELGDPQALRRNASTALLGHILEETGMGVMDSGVRERTRMTFGTTKGTVMGELARSTMLFKGFSASMMMKHWTRAKQMEGASSAMYAARLIVMGTILGGVATQLRNLAGGKDPANIVEPKFWGEAVLRGGGLGFYGDFLYSELTSHDTSLIPALVGPLATEGETAWNLTGGAAFKAARGERTDEKANLIRWGKSNIPVVNNWYTKAALDHLVWNEIQEASSPGYLDKMQAKAEATRGTTYWWNPHDSAPQATPDLMKAWQPNKGAEQLHSVAQVAENMFPSLE